MLVVWIIVELCYKGNRTTQRKNLYDFYMNTDKYNGRYVSQSHLFC